MEGDDEGVEGLEGHKGHYSHESHDFREGLDSLEDFRGEKDLNVTIVRGRRGGGMD